MSAVPPREFVRAVRDYCREHELLPAASGAGRRNLVVGVSGGPDSLALLDALHELSGPLRLRLHVAHLDHSLRKGAAGDARFVARHAARLGWPRTGVRVDVAGLSRRRGCSLEEAGRLARYAFFWRVARRVRARAVAVGHHRDDQAETVLMRLLRGASGSGLSGMAPKRRLVDPLGPGTGPAVWLIRPLLGLARADVEAFLAARGLKARRDRTNFNRGFARNRIRHELIPMLERRYNPGLRAALARAAQALEEDDAVLEAMAERLLGEERGGRFRRGRVPVSARRLNASPLPVRRRALRLAAGRAGAALSRLTQAHLDALVRLAAAARGEAHIPGAAAVRAGGSLVFRKSLPGGC